MRSVRGFVGVGAPLVCRVAGGSGRSRLLRFEPLDGFAGGVGAALDAFVDGFEVADVAVQRLDGGVEGVQSLREIGQLGFDPVEAVVDGRRVGEVADGRVAVGHRTLYRSQPFGEVVVGHATEWPRSPV